MMANEAIDAEDEDFSHGKWNSPQAALSRHKLPRQPRILPGLCLPDQTDRSAAERHAGCAVRGREVRCRHFRAVEFQLQDRKRASPAAARDEATLLHRSRWIARGR